MITSTANRQVKLLIQLNRKKKFRDERGVFAAEGPKMLREAPAERIEKVYFSESYAACHAEELLDLYGVNVCDDGPESAEGVPAFEFEVMQDNVFRAVCDTGNPQGVISVVRRIETSLDDLIAVPNPLIVLLENLQDPGNLGTIMRTAEGAGASGVILGGSCVDLYNPKTVRSTMGSIYRIPVCKAPDPLAAVSAMRGMGIRSYAARLDGTACYDDPDYTAGTAFLIGNESAGLSDALSAAADELIRIPMEGRLESLNASVAASLLMYEAYRCRRK